MSQEFAPLLAASINAGTPLLLAALGLLINEKSGVVNLGAEGMMLVAAALGFVAASSSGQIGIGLLVAMLAGVALAGVFALLVLGLGTNQYATGLALSLFGGGLSAYLGIAYVGISLKAAPAGSGIWLLRDLPWAGPALFSHHWLVYAALVLCFVLSWFLYKTRAGLILRAVGESPQSAHALGYPVQKIRALALLAGGACCGLAGGYLSLIYTPLWVEGMVAGRGWIALALTTFATWRPLRVLAGAYLFGGVTILGFHAQGLGLPLASQLLAMLPYLATIIVLVLISRNANYIKLNMPASLGKNFDKS